VPTTLDHAGRVLAPVMINDAGPFRFILDTGANRSVLSPRLLPLLKLTIDSEVSIGVHGVTGSAVLPAVTLREVKAGELVLGRDTRVPVLSQSVLANADGILGIDGLGMARIEVDFDHDVVRITTANGRQPKPSGFLTIPATLKRGGLLMVPAQVGRVKVKAIIDTGAERTLGNVALRDALLRSRRRGGGEIVRTVLGATPELGQGTALVAPTIYIGEAELHDLEVTFGDLHVFQVWELDKEPALLVGMDLLGAVQRLIIDYRRQEVLLKPRT
jgi:hypothetical protein